MQTDLFQSCGHCWIFQICWPIECSTFTDHLLGSEIGQSLVTSPSFGILLPPLALFIEMLPKATWLCTPGCLTLGWWSHHHYLPYSCSLLQESTQAPCLLPSPHWQWMLEQLSQCCAMATLVPSSILLDHFFFLCFIRVYNFFLNFILFNFTILYWFCHISKWICHRYTCVPHHFLYYIQTIILHAYIPQKTC